MNENALKDEFLAFREECIWAKCCYNTYTALYEDTEETRELLSRIANIFFHDLNKILIEYCWLQFCKLTDQATSCGRDNLTIKYLNNQLESAGLLTSDIIAFSSQIEKYRKILSNGRNRLVSHLDKETVLAKRIEGAHQPENVHNFFHSLQLYCDAVGNALGSGPLDFYCSPEAGDVIDLIRKLKATE